TPESTMRKTILENGRDDVIDKGEVSENADKVSSRNSPSSWTSRSSQEILFGETRVGTRRGEARRTLLPLRWQLLRPVRVRGSSHRQSHPNGVGGCRHRIRCSLAQSAWGGV